MNKKFLEKVILLLNGDMVNFNEQEILMLWEFNFANHLMFDSINEHAFEKLASIETSYYHKRLEVIQDTIFTLSALFTIDNMEANKRKLKIYSENLKLFGESEKEAYKNIQTLIDRELSEFAF